MAEIGTGLYLAYENGYEAGKKDATQQWISVKERMPDDYVPVLVYAKHIDGKRAVFLVDHIIGYTNGCKTWADIDKTWKYSVTHWMPLPEPPKEVNDGNS